MRIQSIYDKLAKYNKIAEAKKPKKNLAKVKKVDLAKKVKTFKLQTAYKKYCVTLNAVSDLLEQAGISGSNYQYAIEEFVLPGRELLIQGRDVIRFEEPHPEYIQDELDVIKEKLDELGVDYPDQIQEVQDAIDYAIESHNELYREIENIGMNPMVDYISK